MTNMPTPVMERPRLRPVEAFPVDAGSSRIICLRDPMNISQRIIGVPSRALYIISLMDGTRSLTDIQVEYLRRYHEVLPTPDLEKLVSDLDDSLMLDSPAFQAHLADLERSYLDAPLRVPTHLGAGYEEEVDVLRQRIEEYFRHPEGPACDPPQVPKRRSTKKGERLLGLISPHIDYNRGGPTYAWAYREVARSSQADLYVILGTSHVPMSGYFSVTRKDFATPFGPMRTDRAFLDLLDDCVGEKMETDPLVHRGEHSIELQTVWLSYLLGGRKVSIAPILCGSLGHVVESGLSPRDVPEVSRFLEGLRTAIARYGKKVVLVAAADLAHIGTGFGDAAPPSDQMLREVEEADLASMQAAAERDAVGFYRTIQREQDRRRVCGLSPIYAMLEVLEARQGRLLKYKQCIDPNGFRTVTIASAAFYG